MAPDDLKPESVWDYPRPPRVEPVVREVRIEFAGEVIARSASALRVLETASPPTVYVPTTDVRMDLTRPRKGQHSVCEWKGKATYLDLVVDGEVAEAAGWFYPSPREAYAELVDHISFYPGRVAAAYLGSELVRPQAGKFYGGWITGEIQGPFKGDPGSEGW
jgi:uncharacterized protein (DUF427 family)